MRVLHVIDILNTGGAEKVFIDLTHLLISQGVDVAVLLFNSNGDITHKLDKRLNIYDLKRVNKFSIVKMWQMHRICNAYDIVHVHMRHCYQYARLVQLLFGGKYKIILHDHYGIDKEIPQSLKGIFKPRYYIGVCQSLVDWSVNSIGISKSNVFLLRNIIIPKQNKTYRAPSANKVMMVANISRVKNIEFAIDLFEKMEWQCTIFGSSRDDVYYGELTDRIGDNSQIEIVSGVTDFSDVYDQYKLAIHCSRSESGPLVLMEYMAYGIPFIAYKTGEVAEVVYNDLPFLFMGSFETDAWERRIQDILGMKDLSSQLKGTFSKYFSPEKYVAECMEIYKKVGS